MNEELTREVLEAIRDCNFASSIVCAECPATQICKSTGTTIRKWLAAALIEERAKPKGWDGAPEWAKSAIVIWSDTCKNEPANRRDYSPRYTRELPKTRARQIAEKEGHGLAEKYGWHAAAEELVTNVMEAALNKYAEELEVKE